jgi:hypothetical protein
MQHQTQKRYIIKRLLILCLLLSGFTAKAQLESLQTEEQIPFTHWLYSALPEGRTYLK